MNDLRFAFRQLLKHPGFTAAAALALALGIGANSALFSVIDRVLFTPLPFRDPERLVMIQSTDLPNQIQAGSVTGPDFADWRRDAKSFVALTAADLFARFNLSGRGEPRVIQGASVTPDFFRVFITPMRLGRAFVDEESRPGHDNVLILGHRFWQRQFGGDPGILGQTLTLDGRPFTVIGVTGPLMSFIDDSLEVYRPLSDRVLTEGRGNYHLSAFGRLKDGTTREQAQAELSTLCRAIAKEFPWKGGRDARVASLHEELVKVARPAFLVLYAAVALVLLIACVNVGNLLLARAEGRSREMAIRASLGASRARVIRQLLTESVLLSLAGGALGLVFAQSGIHTLLALSPRIGGRSVPFFDDIGLDARVLLFTGVVAVLVGILFGLAPAWHATRCNLAGTLKDAGPTSSGGRQHRMLEAFVVAQIALSMVLLTGAGLMIRNFARLARVEPGFDPDHVLTLETELNAARYGDGARILDFYREVLRRVSALPGVESAGVINLLPMGNGNSSWVFRIMGAPELPQGHYNLAEYRVVSPDYLTTLRLPLKQGRWFTAQDRGEPPLMVINQTLARRFFPDHNPLGQRIALGSFTNGCEIVGVVGDEKAFGLGASTPAVMFLPYTQGCWGRMSLVVRTRTEPLSLAHAVRQEIWAVDPDQPVSQVRSLEQVVGESISVQRFAAMLLSVFACAALALAALGIYGVLAYAVSRRTHELGVRMALGADAANILRLVLGKGLKLIGLGQGIGLVSALAVGTLMRGLLYEMSPRDPATFVLVLAVLGGVALVACYLPARRAVRVDCTTALRYE